MTPAEIAFVARAKARMARMKASMLTDYLRSIRIIRESLSEAELVRLIKSGQVERLIDEVLSDKALDRATLPLQQRVRKVMEESFGLVTRDLPRAGKVDGATAVAFNVTSPNVVTAIEGLDTLVLGALKKDVRETVRDAVRRGYEAQQSPAAIAREIRPLIGLGPTQAEQVANFRDALSGVNNRRVQDYRLRNKTVDRLLAKGPLTPEQVDRYTESYRKARVAQNADTVARTALTDSYRAGQDLSWQEAKAKGVIPPGYGLEKEWLQIQRASRRDEHIPLHGERRPFDEPYSNGSMIPGDQGEYNCGCLSRVRVVRLVA